MNVCGATKFITGVCCLMYLCTSGDKSMIRQKRPELSPGCRIL